MTYHDGIEIRPGLRGGAEFVRAVTEALDLLRKSKTYAPLIRPNVAVVACGRRSTWKAAEMRCSLRSPKVVLRSPPGFVAADGRVGLERLALTLAHEAYHNVIFRDFMGAGRSGWGWEWALYRQANGGRDERACIAFEIAVGRELGFDARRTKTLEVVRDCLPHPDLPRLQRWHLLLARQTMLKHTR